MDDAAPPSTRHWGWLGTTLFGVGIATLFVIVQTIAVAAFAFGLGPEHVEAELTRLAGARNMDGTALAVSTLATTVLCGAAILVAVRLKRGARVTEYLALGKVPGGAMMRWLGALAVYLVAVEFVTLALGRPLSPFMTFAYATANPRWMLWVAIVLAGPLFEEMFFRGFLYKGLAASAIGPVGTILLTSVLWAAVHLQYDAFDIAVIGGAGGLLGLARLHTGTLWVPLAMHGAQNLVATVQVALAQ